MVCSGSLSLSMGGSWRRIWKILIHWLYCSIEEFAGSRISEISVVELPHDFKTEGCSSTSVNGTSCRKLDRRLKEVILRQSSLHTSISKFHIPSFESFEASCVERRTQKQCDETRWYPLRCSWAGLTARKEEEKSMYRCSLRIDCSTWCFYWAE